MPLTKIDLIEMIYGELNIPKKECVQLVESFFDISRMNSPTVTTS
jgi:nucleoid DNA-binding protein